MFPNSFQNHFWGETSVHHFYQFSPHVKDTRSAQRNSKEKEGGKKRIEKVEPESRDHMTVSDPAEQDVTK